MYTIAEKTLMSGAIPILTYLQISDLPTQLIPLELNHLRKISFSSARHGTCQFFSQCFYQIHINMTNDCVSITKTLMMGVKSMTERYKKILT